MSNDDETSEKESFRFYITGTPHIDEHGNVIDPNGTVLEGDIRDGETRPAAFLRALDELENMRTEHACAPTNSKTIKHVIEPSNDIEP